MSFAWLLAALLCLLPGEPTRRAACDAVELNRYPGGWGVSTQMLVWRGVMVQEHHPMTNGHAPPYLFLPDEGRYAVGVMIERSSSRRLKPGEGTGVVRREWDEPAIIYCDQIWFIESDHDREVWARDFIMPANRIPLFPDKSRIKEWEP